MKLDRFLVQKFGLALAIIIVLNMFFNYGIYSFYPSPQYEDYCVEELRTVVYDTQDSCDGVGGLWITSFSQTMGERPRERPREVPLKIADDGEFKPYCDPTFSCSKDLREATSVYNRNVFIVLILLGAIAIGGAFMTISVSSVSTGLLYGGLISFFIGTTRFWSDMNEYLRFIILGIVLVALIVVGFKKLNDKKDLSK